MRATNPRRCSRVSLVFPRRGFEPEWNLQRSGRFQGGRRCSRSEQRAKRVVNPTLSAKKILGCRDGTWTRAAIDVGSPCPPLPAPIRLRPSG
jgi:hypothetical protein